MRAGAAVRAAAGRLLAAGVTTPEQDAELLLRHLLGWDRATLLTRGDVDIAPGDLERYDRLVSERARRRPLQHLVGTQAFWRHEFLVTPDALIPRPETETLVEAALEALRGTQGPRVVDVGTGSGCIALSLAAELKDATVHATDVSPAALAVARDNARRLGLVDRVSFHEGDLLAPVAGLGPFDLVASNPPYVGPDELGGLAPEVRDHEPRLALVPPGDALAIYRRLVPEARALLKPGGLLLLEIGAGLERGVVELCERDGFTIDRVIPDLQAIPRTVVARAGYPAPAGTP